MAVHQSCVSKWIKGRGEWVVNSNFIESLELSNIRFLKSGFGRESYYIYFETKEYEMYIKIFRNEKGFLYPEEVRHNNDRGKTCWLCGKVDAFHCKVLCHKDNIKELFAYVTDHKSVRLHWVLLDHGS